MKVLFLSIISEYEQNKQYEKALEEQTIKHDDISVDDLNSIIETFKDYKDDKNFGGKKELVKFLINENFIYNI